MNQTISNFHKLAILEKKNQYQKNYISFNYTEIRNEYIKRKGTNNEINFNRNKKSFSRNGKLIYYCILIKLIIFSALFNISNQNLIQYGYSSIRLMINGTGEVKIFSSGFKYLPNEIKINSFNQSEIKSKYNLTNITNYITLIWHDEINDTSYMFDGCSEITEIDFSNFTTSNVVYMNYMFYGCSSLHSLNLSNFDTSNVKYMERMFYGCSSLNLLDLSNFNTSNVESMNNMFYGCSTLNLLDLSNFDTSNVKSMNNMFGGCSSLHSLDLSNFDTSHVTNMYCMFYKCVSLSSLNLYNFNTSNVISMLFMFANCLSLNSLNLSSFNTSKVTDMAGIFYHCTSLHSLDLSNFNIGNYTTTNYMFYNCPNLEYINLKNAYFEKSTLFNSLSDNLMICISKNMIFDNITFENISINCIGKTIENEDKIKCYSKKKNIYNNNICQNCGYNFYPIYNNSDININCIESMNNYCIYYYYFNITSKIFYCTNECPNDYNKLVPYRNECIINCENESIYKYEYYNICYNKKMNQSMNDMIKDFKNEFNKTDIDNGNDKKIIDKNIIMIFTSTQNQKDNVSNLTMNLGQCENILKYNYNISNNNSLYMLLVIHEEDGKKVPKVEYEIYYPLSNNNLTKLDMNYCQGTKIEISIAIKFNGDIDKYNTSSNYYNDICSKTTSSSGTDISLIDRRNEFNRYIINR